MNARRPTTEQLPCRYWFAVSVPAAEVDDDLSDALASAADRAESVLQEERGYEATVWRSAVPNRAEVLREAADHTEATCPVRSETFPKPCVHCSSPADRLRRLAEDAEDGVAQPPSDVTVYRAEYEHEPFLPIGLYANSDAARAHCEHLVRQEWTPSTPLAFEWSVDEDDPNVIELDVRVETDTWSTGYTVKAVVADAEFDPEADA